jgi:hypothetical protein
MTNFTAVPRKPIRSHVNDETVVLEFFGPVPSVKNEKQATMRKRKRATPKGEAGSLYPGITIKPTARLALQRLEFQVPGDLRGLRLVHPDIDVEFYVDGPDFDRDNIWSTLCDVLVRYEVLVDDDIRHLNGDIRLHPAVVTDHWRTVIRLKPRAKT